MATYEETKEALEGSIRKWELIVSGKGIDDGAANCPLCQLFQRDSDDKWEDDYDDCEGCPMQYVGYSNCYCHEYLTWTYHIRHMHLDPQVWYSGTYKVYCPECENLANDMVTLLKSLRPIVDKMFADEDE